MLAVWGELKEVLNEKQPTYLEGRAEFIQRLKAAVKWMNKHRADRLWYPSTNQKERADECLASKLPGV